MSYPVRWQVLQMFPRNQTSLQIYPLGPKVQLRLGSRTASNQLRVQESVSKRVSLLAELAFEAGIGGCVCSPWEVSQMREKFPESIRVILPGKCYRYEQITPRSEHQFFQVEGLTIGKNIRLTDLIGVMSEFAHKMYGKERKIRIRGSYFPFTEPSIEIDMSCSCVEKVESKSLGCRLCKYTGWLEVAGAGMVHPVVLKNGGYNPDEWSGFAFGMGVERPALLKHDIDDIRYFYGNDLRFLQQF